MTDPDLLVNRVVTSDPAGVVREARERGETVELVTTHDPHTDSLFVAWYLVQSNRLVVEGVYLNPA